MQELGIPESQLIGVQPTDVLKKYIQTQLSAAENNDWVMGLVAIIPCVVVSFMQEDRAEFTSAYLAFSLNT